MKLFVKLTLVRHYAEKPAKVEFQATGKWCAILIAKQVRFWLIGHIDSHFGEIKQLPQLSDINAFNFVLYNLLP